MQTLNFSIFINAPVEKVWDTMLEDSTYREWTSVFNPTSYYKGDWSQGSKMLFMGTNPETGEEGGMVSLVKENRLHEYVSLEHYAELNGSVEKPWEGETAFENYTFIDEDGGTELKIELVNIPDEYSDMFDDMWPKALEKLKEIVER